MALKVAVIGGGASGLAATRVLSRTLRTKKDVHTSNSRTDKNGYGDDDDIVVLEQDGASGGVWRHVPDDPSRPMYSGLRTNLPREIMGFREKPWGSIGKPNSYATHREVLGYLEEYKESFGLDQFIHYNSKVTRLTVLHDKASAFSNFDGEPLPKVELEWRNERTSGVVTGAFDAVCIANGHFAKGSIPPIPGLSSLDPTRTTVMHSIVYDKPEVFRDEIVLCIGGRASGSDLAREIAQYAKHVYLSDSTATKIETKGKVTVVPKTARVRSDGSIECDHHTSISESMDVIVCCTGYDYDYPFISDDDEASSGLSFSSIPGEKRVMPLYKQLWHAEFPNLCFLGLPHSILPFPLFELQAEAFVATLLGKGGTSLPNLEQRMMEARIDSQSGGFKHTTRVKDTHYLGSGQWDYFRELAQIGGETDPERIDRYVNTTKEIWDHSGKERKGLFPGGPDIYRETLYQRDPQSEEWQVLRSQVEAVDYPIPIKAK